MTKGLLKKFESILNDPFINSENAIAEIKSIIESESSKSLTPQPTELAAELVARQTERLTQPIQADQYYRTGFESFDADYYGFYPGELIVLGGRPGMGKTSVMISLALNMSLKHSLAFISMDDSAETLTNRIISALSGVSPNKIRDRQLNDEELSSITNTKAEIQKRLLFINDTLFNNVYQLSDYIREQATENNLKIFFIDYLQLLNNSRQRHYNRDQEISGIMRELKALCKDLNITILISSQLSRNVEMRGGDKRPFLSDLRDSGSIEQDADKVLFVYRPEYYLLNVGDFDEPEKLLYLIIAKNRNGGIGEVVLSHNTFITQFKSNKESEKYFAIGKSIMDGLANNPWE